MSGFTVTLKGLRQAGACVEGYNKVVCALSGKDFDPDRESYIHFRHGNPISLLFILESNGLDDALWSLRCVEGEDKDIRLFAVWCARQVQNLMKDDRSVKSLDIAEKYAHGKATIEELSAARAAARAVASDAARDAARAATSAAASAAASAASDAASDASAASAASDAAWHAASAAAWHAASAAASAAWHAARDAARAAARAAAWDAARDAARAAARDAARAAASDTAWDAAWDAARDAQKQTLIEMCQGNAPWQTENMEK